MPCTCCNGRLNSGMIKKVDSTTGAIYKSCPHCTHANGSEHVFHRYPSAYGNTPARVTASNPDGHQSYCKNCRTLPKGAPSNSYNQGALCSNL